VNFCPRTCGFCRRWKIEGKNLPIKKGSRVLQREKDQEVRTWDNHGLVVGNLWGKEGGHGGTGEQSSSRGHLPPIKGGPVFKRGGGL